MRKDLGDIRELGTTEAIGKAKAKVLVEPRPRAPPAEIERGSKVLVEPRPRAPPAEANQATKWEKAHSKAIAADVVARGTKGRNATARRMLMANFCHHAVEVQQHVVSRRRRNHQDSFVGSLEQIHGNFQQYFDALR